METVLYELNNLTIYILWITLKNSFLYIKSKDNNKVDIPLYVFLMWLAISFGIIIFSFQVYVTSLEALLSLLSLNKNIATSLYYIPFLIDLLSSFIIRFPKSKIATDIDINYIINYEFQRGVFVALLTFCAAFVLSLSFFLLVFLANVFHLKIPGNYF